MTEYEIRKKALLERFPPMHEALGFDTHHFYKRLMEADITEQQAEALLEGWMLYRATRLAAWNDELRP